MGWVAGWAVLAVPSQAVLTASNAFYNVYVQEVNSAGSAIGQYTISTGAEHPSGAGLDVLFGNGTPGTSFNTIRSYSTGTDYTQRLLGTGGFLGTYGVVTPLGTTGLRTTYTLPGPPTTPDRLTIVQDIKVNGTTFENSSVEITTTLVNDGGVTVGLGVRFLWDLQIGQDDGPTFQQFSPSGPVRFTETDFLAPQFVAFRIEDNDGNPTSPTFNVFGTVTGPSNIIPAPTTPTRLVYAAWARVTTTPFDFDVNPTLSVGVAGGINDSAVLYYFGHNAANAIIIPPGGSAKVSASVLLAPPGFSLGGIEELECQTTIPDPQPTHTGCITRPARFWMEHPIGNDENCVTLLKALQNNGEGIELGFVCLPTTYRNGDAEADAEDALVEALGFYYRKQNRTGEDDGRQTAKLLGSKLCRERKRLAVEMVAATANLVLLGTDPGNCQYVQGNLVVTIPTNVLQLAGAAMVSEDINQVKLMTALLRKFNSLGETNAFPGSWVECDPTDRKTLQSVARDATSRFNCPGINDTCETAQGILSFPFKQSLDLSKYTDLVPSPDCAVGGPDAVWKVAPPVAASGRNFVIKTEGSTFPTVVSVWTGDSCADIIPIACSNQTGGFLPDSYLQFTSNGSNTYYIVVEGVAAAVGSLKVNITSY
jgi:hypothetical protein